MTAKRFRKPTGFTGYRMDLENRSAILARSLPKYVQWRQNLKDYVWEPPAEIDPRSWMEVESQLDQGSCVGNASASCVEYSHVMQYGPLVQLSREYAYLTAQTYDGITAQCHLT